MLNKTFTLAEIGTVLDKNPSTLRTHINRGLVVGQGPRNTGNKPAGAHKRFSFNTLIEFAMAYRLVDMGVQLEDAFRYAADFAHSGGMGLKGPDRIPGFPFHYRHGITIFAASPTRTYEDVWKPGENYDTFGNLKLHTGGDFIAVNATELFSIVCARLVAVTNVQEFHPTKMLDLAYPNDAEAQD